LNSPRRSYFLGCSDGGREALIEAQRFPQDFDGIIAGSPANNSAGLITGYLWDYLALSATSAGDLSQADLDTLSSAVLARCVGKDGGLATDGFLNNPLACHFNPQSLSLARDKVTAIEKIFSGPPGIFPGYGPGGEANAPVSWPTWITDTGSAAAGLQSFVMNNYFGFMVFPNSGWTPTSVSIAENAHQAEITTGAILNALDPNLHPFESRGGKLIQYVGWSDSAISPYSDITYHDAVADAMGGPEGIDHFYRLFMVPGMGHCSGGPGANAFGQYALGGSFNGPNPADPADDVVSALDHWVEFQEAPNKIVATKYVNDDPTQGIAFQRPLCPFPKIARYDGHGTPASASSFACVRPDDDKHAER
jgi:feruloyl esterase